MFGNNTLYHVYLFTVCCKTVRTQCEKHAGSNTEYLVLVACMVFRVLTVLPTKLLSCSPLSQRKQSFTLYIF